MMKCYSRDIYFWKEKRHRKMQLWYHLFCIFTASCGEVYFTNLEMMSGLVYPTLKAGESNKESFGVSGCTICNEKCQ